MNTLQSLLEPGPNGTLADVPPKGAARPADILSDTGSTDDEKRALLASWASDANAVPHRPTLRQLPNGSLVKVADILRSLKALDARAGQDANKRRLSFQHRRDAASPAWFSRKNRNDDDDPPPCPAYAAVRPRGGGGAAFNFPEPVLA